MITTTEIIPDIKNQFDDRANRLYGWKELRREALEAFTRNGLPTTRHEEWKYTNLKNIIAAPLEFEDAVPPSPLRPSDIDRFRIGGKNALVLVFENGRFVPSLSDEIPPSYPVRVSPLAGSGASTPALDYLGKVAGFHSEPMVALNTAFFSDGVCIHAEPGTRPEQALHIMHVSNSENPSHVASMRNLVVAEQGSRVTVIESYHSRDNRCKGIINTVTEIVVKANAFVEHVKAQMDSDASGQINFTQVVQEKDSTFDTVTVTLSGRLVRNNLHILLHDVNCTSHLFGLYILDGEQLVDNHTLVDHAMPNCFSNELYKGIIGGKASGVFNGKIFVRKDAQKTNAYQSNKNILLTDEAQMNTKPQLEIFADDVKCTHGATTGQMDEEALFYLRSRGIGEHNAKALLNIAFAGDVLNNIKDDTLKENLLNLAVEKLQRNEF